MTEERQLPVATAGPVLSRAELLRRLSYEDARLRTFNSPRWYAACRIQEPRTLAKAGFFYFNDADKVQCAFCLGIVGRWESYDNPMIEHRRHFPRCPFILGLSVGNMPIESHIADNDPLPIHLVQQANPTAPASATAPAAAAERNCCPPQLFERRNAAAAANQVPVNEHDITSPLQSAFGRANFQISTRNNAQPERQQYSSPADQPPPPPGEQISIQDVARNRTAVSAENRKRNALFRLNELPCIEIYMSKKQKIDESDFWRKLGIRTYGIPAMRCFADFNKRLQTFIHWPLQIKQRGKDLADAGFYYLGTSDEVKCFHCDGGLKGWLEGDVPWKEHAKWYPSCHFLALRKGNEFEKEIFRINW